MEQVLAWIGGATLVIIALNKLIKESSLLANSIWEIRKYGFKRRRKDGSDPLVD